MKKVDAKSLEAVHTHTHTHTIQLLTKVSLLNAINTIKLCLLNKIANKYNIEKAEIEPMCVRFCLLSFFCCLLQ